MRFLKLLGKGRKIRLLLNLNQIELSEKGGHSVTNRDVDRDEAENQKHETVQQPTQFSVTNESMQRT